MSGRILIVGGGEAGLTIAVTLRELGHTGEICLVGAEPFSPYQRPPLSKEYLTDGGDPAFLRAPEFYAANDIRLVTGRSVTSVERHAEGGAATLDDGTVLEFSRLALATGSTPRRLPVPGAGADGVVALRTIDDAHVIRAGLERARDVVIVGGGFVGLEVAAAARARGAAVTVVEAADRVLGRVVAEPMSTFVRRHHEAAGIRIETGRGVTGIGETDGRADAVLLDDGEEVPADLVIVGVGAVPVTDLAVQMGLQCRPGIVVDDHARSSDPGIVAAGDCAVQPHPHREGDLIGIESVNNATEQGKVAAHSLLDMEPPARGVPWFWSNQGALKIQIAGISDGHDHYVIRRGADDRLTVLYYRAGLLIAGDTVNDPREHMAIKRALAQGSTVDPAVAGDTSVPLKSLVTPAAGSGVPAPR
ncbi:pyridine nucleotide-disulfide oxidoreductase [Gordonia jinghuaiqii]|uniref:FAD-dependent oxidoreductase n=1 Tax=Gordonia jinghuaiqii TaxID=2758710 RepID=A0A7D7LVE6_9ACTN|nr:FAD-dependent oxidoreductase [Gordonia jinghuaiqii]MCR5978040.1 pyridine nucleotide-disulfide oxidoreductase [Gordonia jinghuaiqii]QMT01495.1 FAD-dependent oxidoreductase [Gordonia jinghuaiqii]